MLRGNLTHTMFRKRFYTYFVASRSRTLYVGVTSDLAARIHEHKTRAHEGFTARYRVDRLVYFEEYLTARDAIAREKEMKSWRRSRKTELVEQGNPSWADLSDGWYASLEPDVR